MLAIGCGTHAASVQVEQLWLAPSGSFTIEDSFTGVKQTFGLFYPDGSHFLTFKTDGGTPVSQATVTVDPDKPFIIGSAFGSATNFDLDAVVENIGPDTWKLTFNPDSEPGNSSNIILKAHPLLAVPMVPMPLPSAAVLFGSSLVGMIGIAWRRRKIVPS
jgi:hypothetical protein